MSTEASLVEPSLEDIYDAARVVGRHLHPTPLHNYPALSELLGCDVWVKHENHQPIGAFKVRGGVNFVSRLGEDERAAGLTCASTGNHGQSIAWAGRLFGVDVQVVVPEGSNPDKVASMRRLGAEVVSEGTDFDEAREACEEMAARSGRRYVHAGNEPWLIAGVGTIGLEILRELPDVDVIIVPVGGGSGASGISIAAHGINAGVEVIGVQSEAAPAAHQAWLSGHPVTLERMETSAEGLATRSSFELPQKVMRAHLADFVLVTEEEIARGVVTFLETTHNLAEPAAGATAAAALRLGERLSGRRVALSLSGGNMTLDQLRDLLGRQG